MLLQRVALVAVPIVMVKVTILVPLPVVDAEADREAVIVPSVHLVAPGKTAPSTAHDVLAAILFDVGQKVHVPERRRLDERVPSVRVVGRVAGVRAATRAGLDGVACLVGVVVPPCILVNAEREGTVGSDVEAVTVTTA